MKTRTSGNPRPEALHGGHAELRYNGCRMAFLAPHFGREPLRGTACCERDALLGNALRNRWTALLCGGARFCLPRILLIRARRTHATAVISASC